MRQDNRLASNASEAEVRQQADEAVVEAVRHSPERFRELYDRYLDRVRAYISYRVPRMEDADDLTAQVFLKAIEALHCFVHRGDGSFAAWLFRIAHNQVADFYRKQASANDRLIPIDELDELADVQAHDSELLPDHVVSQQELFVSLRNLVQQLPARQQEVITLKFFGGLRNKEIAGILALDERSVAAHLCRGLKELHRRYGEDYEPVEGDKHDN